MDHRSHVSEIKREKEAIRLEMERVVQRMQLVESELDHGNPRSENKREELNILRSELADLRVRMKRVMDSASNATPSRTLDLSNATPHRNPVVSYRQPVVDTSDRTISPTRQRETTQREQRFVSPPKHRTQSSTQPVVSVSNSNYESAPSDSSIRRTSSPSSSSIHADHVLLAVRQRHSQEKGALREEYERLLALMDKRHAEEIRQCNEACQLEAQQRREFEESRLRMERAQRNLERLHQQQTVSRPPVEVAQLSNSTYR